MGRGARCGHWKVEGGEWIAWGRAIDSCAGVPLPNGVPTTGAHSADRARACTRRESQKGPPAWSTAALGCASGEAGAARHSPAGLAGTTSDGRRCVRSACRC